MINVSALPGFEQVTITSPGFKAINTYPHVTLCGTPYFADGPGVAMLSKPDTNPFALTGFLDGFEGLGFTDYLNDPTAGMTDAEEVCKISGQLCYLSFGPKRTMNAEIGKYLDHIKSSGHGSVLEHANFSFLFYGVSRSLTHELVRHRLFSYSQVSQRYVSGRVLRFVERPEYAADLDLHDAFIRRIDQAAADYEQIAQKLLGLQQSGDELLSAEAKTDARKKVNQAARSLLPNETESPIIVTGNVRAWRHFLEMRCSPYAEVEIRALAYRLFLCLVAAETHLFSDYRVVTLPDGTWALETDYRKV